MRLLVLGGTAWLGRAVAAAALEHGHEVSCLARGASGTVPDGAILVAADRDGPEAYASVQGQRWDAVVDVSRQPGHVRRAVAALEPVAARYLLVSTGNVYADQRTLHQDEDAPLLPPLEGEVLDDMAWYGQAKVACEQAVLAAFGPGRTVIARAGLIGGPGDPSGRSGYWPWRFAFPAEPALGVLVPDALERLVELIDVRDVAGWLVTAAERGLVGTFNVAGEALPLGEHLAAAARAAGYEGRLVPAPERWLREQGVEMWMGPRSLPLWIDDPDWWGFTVRSTERAAAAGLERRPVQETYAGALETERLRPEPGPHGAGLADAEERDLLAVLAGAADPPT